MTIEKWGIKKSKNKRIKRNNKKKEKKWKEKKEKEYIVFQKDVRVRY